VVKHPASCIERAIVRRLILPLLFGLCGAAVLIGLGVWQMQRLEWKTGVLAAMEARIGGPPIPLPAVPNRARDNYQTVSVTGRFLPGHLDVMSGQKLVGPGFRVIAPFETDDGRRVMIDRGFVPDAERKTPRDGAGITEISGNLLWPDDADSYTPAPNLTENLWFARDVVTMAKALNTEPVLIVAFTDTGEGISPVPVDSMSVPNNHFQYAVTWFSLALVWLGMTVFWLRRMALRIN
jgi:surfeit locus 1 family protein